MLKNKLKIISLITLLVVSLYMPLVNADDTTTPISEDTNTETNVDTTNEANTNETNTENEAVETNEDQDTSFTIKNCVTMYGRFDKLFVLPKTTK